VKKIESRIQEIVLETNQGTVRAMRLISCGGRWSDRLIWLSGEKPVAPIVAFRGEYYVLKPEAHLLCRNLIYPTPAPAYPFLGIHFTGMIHGGVECGPYAVLAFARAGYTTLQQRFIRLIEHVLEGEQPDHQSSRVLRSPDRSSLPGRRQNVFS